MSRPVVTNESNLVDLFVTISARAPLFPALLLVGLSAFVYPTTDFSLFNHENGRLIFLFF
jgi:hypothetical protein